MADNFNLRQFLTENKLTKNAKLLKEQEQELSYPFGEFGQGVKDIFEYYNEEAISFAPDIVFELIDELIQEYDLDPMSGEIDTDPMEARLLELYRAAQTMDTEKFGEFAYNELSDGSLFIGGDEDDDLDENIEEADWRNNPYTSHNFDGVAAEVKKHKHLMKIANELFPQYGGNLENFKPLSPLERNQVYRQYTDDTKVIPFKEAKQSPREKYLTRLVENALGIQPTDYDPDNEEWEDDEPFTGNYVSRRDIEEGEDMVQEKPLPKYENIEKLMQEIEHGTNEAASKHKIMKMKEVAEMLEARVGSLEEGDGAEFVDAKKVKQMKKDIMTLRKQAEKLEKEYDKKFSGKEKKETSKAKKEDVTLAEGTFDLRKFLAENKLTTSSRMLKENVNIEQAFTQAGINLETPATVAINDDLGTIVEYEKFNTGKEALEYVKQEMQSEYLAGELPEIHYEGDIEPSSELEVQPKLEFQFEDADIVIIQA